MASAAPGPAAGLHVVEDNVNQPVLVWYPGADSTGAKIYRDGQLIDTISTPFMASTAWWQDTTHPSSGSHNYDVIMTGFGGTVSSAGATQVDLKDGSFQAPRVTNGAWITYYPPSQLGGWEVLSDSVDLNDRSSWQQTPNGGQTVDLTGGFAGGIQQTISTPGGSSVPMRLTFQMAGNYQCMDNTKSVTVTAGSSNQTFTHSRFTGWNVATRAGWQKKTLDFTPSGDTTLIKFTSNNAMWCGPLIGDVRVVRQDGQTGVNVNVDPYTYSNDVQAASMGSQGYTGPDGNEYIGGTWTLFGYTSGYSDEGSVEFRIHVVGQPANKVYRCPGTKRDEWGSGADYTKAWACDFDTKKYLPASGQIEVTLVGNSISSTTWRPYLDNVPPPAPTVSGLDKTRSDLTSGTINVSGGADEQSGTIAYQCRLQNGVNATQFGGWERCAPYSPSYSPWDDPIVTSGSQAFTFPKGPNRIQVRAVDRVMNFGPITEYRWGGNPENTTLPAVKRSGTTLTVYRGIWNYPVFPFPSARKWQFDSSSVYNARVEKRANSTSSATSTPLSGTLDDQNQSATWSHSLGSAHGQVRACVTARNNGGYGTATPEACSSWLTY